MRKITFHRTLVPAGVAALLLAACGGGGGGDSGVMAVTDPNVTGTDVPTSATTNSAAAFAFVKIVAASPNDSAEPIRVGDVTLATSDMAEPEAGV